MYLWIKLHSLFWIKLVSSILLSISILGRWWADSFACIMGGGDFYGANDVVNVDAGIV